MRTLGVLMVLALAPRAYAAEAQAEAARPSALPLTVSLDIDTVWRLDDAYRAFATDRQGTDVGVTASYDVFRLSPRGTLAVALGWHTEGLGRELPAAQSRLEVRVLSASGILRWVVLPWLEPHLRLDLGSAWGEAQLDLNDGNRLEGTAWSPQASAGGGFRLRSHRTSVKALRGLGLGLSAGVEGGFTLGAPMALRLSVPTPDKRSKPEQHQNGGVRSSDAVSRHDHFPSHPKHEEKPNHRRHHEKRAEQAPIRAGYNHEVEGNERRHQTATTDCEHAKSRDVLRNSDVR